MEMRFRQDEDLKNMILFAHQARMKQVEKLGESIREYDHKEDSPKIDSLFSAASELRSRRLDFALYNFAMLSKTDQDEQAIEGARRKVLTELDRYRVKFKRSGLQAWT